MRFVATNWSNLYQLFTTFLETLFAVGMASGFGRFCCVDVGWCRRLKSCRQQSLGWFAVNVNAVHLWFGLCLSFRCAIGVRQAFASARRESGVRGVHRTNPGVPLISLLFMSSVMLPLFMPEGFNIDKLLRAQIAIILFAAAYIAETVRGGLQAIPQGQYEGAASLGLSYWQTMRKIVLPQALKVVIPPLVSIFISLFKDTSLVVIIGIFDLTQAAKVAITDAAWRGFSTEAYLFIAAIYFVFCYSISRYSQSLEQSLDRGHR